MPRVSKGAIVVFGGSTLKVTGGRTVSLRETSGSGLWESRSSLGTDVVSATSGLGGTEVVCRNPLGTGSLAGIPECGVLSLGGVLVVCLGASVVSGSSETCVRESTTSVLGSSGLSRSLVVVST